MLKWLAGDGVFEAAYAHSLQGLMQSVLAANQGKTVRPNKINVYNGTGDRTYTFQTSGGHNWGVVAVSKSITQL
ncbi:MAG TPA: hypothetical protein VFB63_21350 [Bryobacteraceae bacterium]|nr:hypothetical protein [Bryobacteraceae bacterium]